MIRHAVFFLSITLVTPLYAAEIEDQSSHYTSKENKPIFEQPKDKEDQKSKESFTYITPPDIDRPESKPNPPPTTTEEFCKKYPGKFGCPENK